MNADANVAAVLYNKESLMCAAIYTGEKYVVFSSVKDTFDCSVLKSIVNGYGVGHILVSSSLSNIRYKFIAQLGLVVALLPAERYGGTGRLGALDELSSQVLTGLRHYLQHSVFVPVEKHPQIGTIESLPVFFEDITNYVTVSSEIVRWMTREKSRDAVLSKLLTASTAPGRATILAWLNFPLSSRDEIYARHSIQRKLVAFYQPIKTILKRCLGFRLRSRADFEKIKATLAAANDLHVMLKDILPFKEREVYSRLQELLNLLVRGHHVAEGVDGELDRLRRVRRELPARLNSVAQDIADKLGQILTVVYLPQLGFFVASEEELENKDFSLNRLNYCKSEEMKKLDEEIGDVETLVYEAECRAINKIYKEIERVNLCYLSDYVGQVDAYCTLVSFSQEFSCTAPWLGEQRLKTGRYTGNTNSVLEIIAEVELKRRCIFNCSKDILFTCGTISVLAQAGFFLPFSSTHLRTFDKILIKEEQVESLCSRSSTFVSEIRAMKSVLEASTENSLCLLENLGRGTSKREGLAIFLGICENIRAGLLVATTTFQLFNLKEEGIVVKERVKDHLWNVLRGAFSFYALLNKRIQKVKDKEPAVDHGSGYQVSEYFNRLIQRADELIEGKEDNKQRNVPSWAVETVKDFVENCYEESGSPTGDERPDGAKRKKQ